MGFLASLWWRYTPDAIALLFGCFMSFVKIRHVIGRKILRWWGIPYLAAAFMIISTLQRGDARKNISRILLESSPMNFLGYVSYPTCEVNHIISLVFNFL